MRKMWIAVAIGLLAACVNQEVRQGRWVTGECFEQDSLRIEIEHRGDSMHMVTLSANGEKRDSLLLPYPMYRFDCGDLTGNGLPEIAIGVVKGARYWPTPEKRLFVYHLFDGRYIRPLWMGSRVGNPLKDFKICRDSVPALICTEEWAKDSTVVERMYEMRGFGLSIVCGEKAAKQGQKKNIEN